jgi:hypothetical protein
MRKRFRLYKRKKGGRYYIHDEVTGKQDSLHTRDRATAVRLFHSRQEAEHLCGQVKTVEQVHKWRLRLREINFERRAFS